MQQSPKMKMTTEVPPGIATPDRLETKLGQLNKHIVRDELLLGDRTDTGSLALKASIHKASAERDDITLLLEEIRERLENIEKPE